MALSADRLTSERAAIMQARSGMTGRSPGSLLIIPSGHTARLICQLRGGLWWAPPRIALREVGPEKATSIRPRAQPEAVLQCAVCSVRWAARLDAGVLCVRPAGKVW